MGHPVKPITFKRNAERVISRRFNRAAKTEEKVMNILPGSGLVCQLEKEAL